MPRKCAWAGSSAFLLALSAICLSAGAQAQLVGGQVTHGSASITETAQSALIQQTTQRAVITWQGFSIPRGYSVTVQQPGASSVLLNRVTGGTPSYLLGSLTANGQVWIVNPAGIITGPGAQITAAGLLLSTTDISDANFLAGNAVFDEPGDVGAKVWNGGTITVSDGYAVLAGEEVGNGGVIAARLGSVVLAGATTYTVDFSGDNLLNFAITAPSTGTGTLVSNKGEIAADGGAVLLTAASAKSVLDNVINTSSIVEADSVATQNGKIVLLASGGGTAVSGTLDASGKGAGETGGEVEVLGNSVTLAAGAAVDVSGASGGGTALIGGNFHGAGPEPDAETTTVAAGAVIDADALDDGNSGDVAVWSNGTTTVAGAITARGGAAGGNGGYVETSGATLDAAGITVDTSAARGAAGTWLLDPTDLTIDATLAGEIDAALSDGDVEIETGLSGFSIAATGSVPVPEGDVNLSGSGDITVNAEINWGSNTVLSLSAYRNIVINAPIVNSANGTISLAVDNGLTGIGSISFGLSGSVTAPAATTVVQVGSTIYTAVDFEKNNDIQTNLIAQFPTGLFLANNSEATPFMISAAGSSCGVTGYGACNFYDGFGFDGAGTSVTLDVDVPDATNVMTLVNAYQPPGGPELASIQFIGSGGASVTFPYVGGTDIRDFYQGGYTNSLANTIPGVTTQTAFTVSDVQDAAGTGNVDTGGVGTYHIDEQTFALGPAFAGQTLEQIVFTDTLNGANPILLGVTVASTAGGGAEAAASSLSSPQLSEGAANVVAQVLASSAPPPTSLLSVGLETPSSPVPPPSSGSTSIGSTGSVITLDTGGTAFSTIAPGSVGTPTEPIDNVPPIHPAPQRFPLPPVSDEEIGGAGSALYQSSPFPIRQLGVNGIDTPAPDGGNPSLWYAPVGTT